MLMTRFMNAIQILAGIVGGTFRAYAGPAPDPESTISNLRQKLSDLNAEANTIRATADGEKRPLNDEETTRLSQILDAFDATENEITQRERIIAQERKLSAPAGRKTDPAPAPHGEEPRPTPSGRLSLVEAKGSNGFKNLGEFAQKVKLAVRNTPDNRLLLGMGPTTYGQENVGEDGGYAVPPDFRADIMKKVFGEDSLIGRTDQQISTSNQITFPADETTPWQTTGGIQVYWENEADQLKQSKLELQGRTIRLNKVTALVPVTSELLEDAPALANYLRTKTSEKIDFKLNDTLVSGVGNGQPLGLLQSGHAVQVAAESGQTAGTVVFANIVKMWARMPQRWRQNAVWLINQDVEPLLQQMALVVGTATTSLGFPAYLPPGGLSQNPYGTLMNRPVISTEACSTVGTPGDIILWCPQQYLTVTKVGGPREDVSIHLWFDYDVTAFRWILRIAGQPWWKDPIKRRNGSNTLSSIVTLAQR